MKPIYLFKVNVEEGTIERTEITDYVIKSSYFYNRVSYAFYVVSDSGRKTRYTMDATKFDRLNHKKILSFNPSEEHAKEVIKKELLEQIRRAKATFDNAASAMKALGLGEVKSIEEEERKS